MGTLISGKVYVATQVTEYSTCRCVLSNQRIPLVSIPGTRSQTFTLDLFPKEHINKQSHFSFEMGLKMEEITFFLGGMDLIGGGRGLSYWIIQ